MSARKLDYELPDGMEYWPKDDLLFCIGCGWTCPAHRYGVIYFCPNCESPEYDPDFASEEEKDT